MRGFVYALLIIWQLPQTLVGLIMLPFLGSKRKVGGTDWTAVYECSGMRGGISLGPLCFVSSSVARREAGILHEIGHTRDSRLFGPLYLIIIGIPSLLNAMFHFTKCYFDFYTEKRANKVSNLGVDEWCCLYVKGDE